MWTRSGLMDLVTNKAWYLVQSNTLRQGIGGWNVTGCVSKDLTLKCIQCEWLRWTCVYFTLNKVNWLMWKTVTETGQTELAQYNCQTQIIIETWSCFLSHSSVGTKMSRCAIVISFVRHISLDISRVWTWGTGTKTTPWHDSWKKVHVKRKTKIRDVLILTHFLI